MSPALELIPDASRLRRKDASSGDPSLAGWSQAGLAAPQDNVLSPASVFFDAVLTEIDRRQAAGLPLDLQEFREACPEFAESLDRLFEVRLLLDETPLPPGDVESLPWPEPGDFVLGLNLVEELGRGGLARVFSARQPSLGGRQVVVKFSAKGGDEACVMGRLEGECEYLVRALSFETDAATRLTAVVMPYLGRSTLEDVCRLIRARIDDKANIKKRPTAGDLLGWVRNNEPSATGSAVLAQSQAAVYRWGTLEDGLVYVVRCIAEALSFAHRRGVCHLDLKPANVLLDPQGRPRLLDFNLSRDLAQSRRRMGGTLPYVSPEQLACMLQVGPAEDVGSASDVYSLGVLFHQLLTGRLPFGPVPVHCQLFGDHAHALDPHQLIAASLRRYNPRADRALVSLIARCLTIDPAGRPTAEEIARILAARLSSARRVFRFCQRHAFALTTGALSLALLVGVGHAALPSREEVAARRQAESWDAARAALRRGDHETAIALLDGLAADSPQDLDVHHWQAAAHYAAGKEEFDFGRWAAAAERFEAAVEVASGGEAFTSEVALPSLPLYLVGLASARYRMGEFAPSADAFRAARNLGGDEVLGVAEGYCALKRRQWADAVLAFQRALPKWSSPELLNNLAFALMKSGDWVGAKQKLDEALQRNPELRPARYNRALVSLAMQNGESAIIASESAVDDMRRALDLGPPSVALICDAAVVFAHAATTEDRHAAAVLLQQHFGPERPLNDIWLQQQESVRAALAEAQVELATARNASAIAPADAFSDRVADLLPPLPPLPAEFR